MNILPIVELQKEKRHEILINQNLSQYKLWARKHLELQVKLSSLAEETKCYKYWIDDGLNLSKETVFIKYADFLAHVINLGIDKHYIDSYEVVLRPNDYCLSDQFLNLYIDINDLIISPSIDHFFTLLEDVLSLGITLGYSEEEIFNSFESSKKDRLGKQIGTGLGLYIVKSIISEYNNSAIRIVRDIEDGFAIQITFKKAD